MVYNDRVLGYSNGRGVVVDRMVDSNSWKSFPLPDRDKAQLIALLNQTGKRIENMIKLVSGNFYCCKALSLSHSIDARLEMVKKALLKAHIKNSAFGRDNNWNEETVDEWMTTINKYFK